MSSGRVSTGRHLVTRGGNRTGGRALLGRGGGPRLLLLLMLLRRLLGAGLASLVTRVLLASVGRVVLGATSDNTKDGRLPVVALANAVLDGKGSLGIRLMSLVVINVGDNGVFTVCARKSDRKTSVLVSLSWVLYSRQKDSPVTILNVPVFSSAL